ncbi:MAG: CubicO group peptidase (beta-lactamase class C family) [Myxococcota bacterium]|jgi:CubicO group peptidase (beta-lactamase class C family)
MLFVILMACQSLDLSANPDETDYPSLSKLDASIIGEMEYSKIPGLSACIIKDGAIVWCQGYGYADIEAERLVTPQTPFLLASVSKAFTAAALAKAAEDGLVDLDAPVGATLPFDVTHPSDPGTPITARQLAAHVSGVADNWDVMDDLYTDGDPTLALGDFMEDYFVKGERFYDKEYNFIGQGPERRLEYSNIGASLAGYVVESATGQDFGEYCEEVLFEPLQMADTSWRLDGLDESTVAMPYLRRLGRYKATGHYGFPDYPSGQLRSGAEPVARFLLAIMSGGTLDGVRIMEPATVSELLTVQFADIDDEQGLGWYSWTLNGREVWGHNGGEQGAATEMLFWPDDGVGAVVLMNSEGDDYTLEEVERMMYQAAADL